MHLGNKHYVPVESPNIKTKIGPIVAKYGIEAIDWGDGRKNWIDPDVSIQDLFKRAATKVNEAADVIAKSEPRF